MKKSILQGVRRLKPQAKLNLELIAPSNSAMRSFHDFHFILKLGRVVKELLTNIHYVSSRIGIIGITAN